MKFFAFVATFVVLFCITYGFLALVDALPEPRPSSVGHVTEQEPAQEPEQVPASMREAPVRVVSKDAGIDFKILNPGSTDIDALNAAVDQGVVHYPESASLGQEGTVLLFGHSSHLPIVHNKAFKAFNNIEKLEKGQVISVYSGTHEYRYKVVSVRLANANEDVVELPAVGKHLAMVTCDNFGVKSDRWVLMADFEGAYSL